MPPKPPLMKPNSLISPAVVHELRKLAAALPDCRGKLTQVVMWRTENEGKCRSRSADLSLEAGDRGALAGCIEAAFSQVLLRHRSACLIKHSELATACDAFQESRGQPGRLCRREKDRAAPGRLRTALLGVVIVLLSSCRLGRK